MPLFLGIVSQGMHNIPNLKDFCLDRAETYPPESLWDIKRNIQY